MNIEKIISELIIAILIVTSILPITILAEEKKLPSGKAYSDIEGVITNYIEEHKNTTASVSLAVFEGQNTLYQTQYGYTDLEEKILVNEETVYEWGSVSKLLVWVSVMQLYEQGKVNFNEDVRRYLPGDFLTKLSYDIPITMMNLMNHTGGWQETSFDIETANPANMVSLEQALRQSEPPQIYEPGTTCAYSNWGCALAAYIIERISGQTFYAYVQNNIFEPLNMQHTAYAPDLSDNVWVQKQRGKLNCYYIDNEYYEDLGKNIRHILLYPAGMATGTLHDFIKFAKALLPDDHNKSILFENANTLTTLLSPTLFYGNTDITRVSHGMWTMQFGVITLGHGGNTSGCTANLLMDPNSKVGVVVMTNQCAENVYTNGLMQLIFGEYKGGEASQTLPSTQHISGIYTSSRTIKKGMFKIYNIIGSLLPLSKTNDENTLSLSIGKGSLTQVVPYQYVFDMGGPKYFIYANESNKHVTLQMMSQDYIKENTVVFFSKVGLLLFGLVGVIFSVIALMVELIGLIIRKIRKKTIAYQPMKKWRIITQLSTVFIAILAFLIIQAKVITVGTMWWKCALCGLLALVPIVYAIMLMIKYRKRECSKREKFNYIVTLIMGLVLTANVLYWQFFNFWTC